jgi:hypothetical protein
LKEIKEKEMVLSTSLVGRSKVFFGGEVRMRPALQPSAAE